MISIYHTAARAGSRPGGQRHVMATPLDGEIIAAGMILYGLYFWEHCLLKKKGSLPLGRCTRHFAPVQSLHPSSIFVELGSTRRRHDQETFDFFRHPRSLFIYKLRNHAGLQKKIYVCRGAGGVAFCCRDLRSRICCAADTSGGLAASSMETLIAPFCEKYIHRALF